MNTGDVLRRLALMVPAVHRLYKEFLAMRDERDQARDALASALAEIEALRRKSGDAKDALALAITKAENAQETHHDLLIQLTEARAEQAIQAAHLKDAEATTKRAERERHVLALEMKRSAKAMRDRLDARPKVVIPDNEINVPWSGSRAPIEPVLSSGAEP